MVIANATGCSSIYGGSFPSTPYTTNAAGRGPAWINSLFEDNAEFGFGLHHGFESMRDRLRFVYLENKESFPDAFKGLMDQWVDSFKDGEKTQALAHEILPYIDDLKGEAGETIKELKDYLVKQSNWIIGGDGWAYDIDYGGLDHIIASNQDFNILVLDTQVYSNTGGQSSKAAPTGSIAAFTASGKTGKKKDLAAMAMTYGHVYVAQVSHGASQQHVVRAMREAEAHDGPSIVIAYSPCIAHKIKGGLTQSSAQAKLAVESGYWPIFRYNPAHLETGKNPFKLDSKEPKWDRYKEFLLNEQRYSQLLDINPDKADDLYQANLADAKRRYRMYQRYEAMDYSNEV